jgi:hypothetical protein
MKIRKILYFLLFIIFLVIFIFVFRLFSPRQIDDVSPGVQCDPELLNKVDVLYVVPKFENKTPSKEWCDSILSMKKDLRMHGVYHTYNEFATTRDESYVNEGREVFKECFGFYPERFKAPQLNISSENKDVIKKTMKLDNYINEIFHKVYHCSDTGKASNRFIDWI